MYLSVRNLFECSVFTWLLYRGTNNNILLLVLKYILIHTDMFHIVVLFKLICNTIKYIATSSIVSFFQKRYKKFILNRKFSADDVEFMSESEDLRVGRRR